VLRHVSQVGLSIFAKEFLSARESKHFSISSFKSAGSSENGIHPKDKSLSMAWILLYTLHFSQQMVLDGVIQKTKYPTRV
jgi:hypothetical protein